MIAGVPPPDVAIPPAVSRMAYGVPVRPVWRNELGGLTVELGTGPHWRFVKWAPAGSGLDLSAEVDRLRWAAPFTPVPRVLEYGADADGAWLVTAALPGESAVTDRWKARPVTAATAIGRGLRALHDRLPVGACPFSWSAPERVAAVRRLHAAGQLDLTRWSPPDAVPGAREVLARLADMPDVDKLVVCHGDACAPNTLIDDAGAWSGHVDLGSLGLADRWADLAVATWSLEWNYGSGFDHVLLDAYGVAPDPERIAYYRLLWDVGA